MLGAVIKARLRDIALERLLAESQVPDIRINHEVGKQIQAEIR